MAVNGATALRPAYADNTYELAYDKAGNTEWGYVQGIAPHFEQLDANTPWLDRIGTDLWDYCQGFARPPGLDPGSRVNAQCARVTTVVYGFDSPLLAKLDMLGETLFAAGWGKIKNVRRDGRPVEQFWVALNGEEILERKDRDFRSRSINPQWRPNEKLGRPACMEGTPPWGRIPLSPNISVVCVSRGQTGHVPPPDHVGDRTRGASRNYLLLDNNEVELHALEEDALQSHEHALTVTIHLAYYTNPNARARPHRIPRYLLPTQPCH